MKRFEIGVVAEFRLGKTSEATLSQMKGSSRSSNWMWTRAAENRTDGSSGVRRKARLSAEKELSFRPSMAWQTAKIPSFAESLEFCSNCCDANSAQRW